MIYRQPKSPYWWARFPAHTGLRRQSLRIVAETGSPSQDRANKRLAEDVYAARLADVARGTFDFAREPETITVREFVAWYDVNHVVHQRAAANTRSVLRKVVARWAERSVGALTRDDVVEWRTAQRQRLAASTVNRDMNILRAMINHAIPRYRADNPATGLKLKTKAVDMRILTNDEEGALLIACEAKPQLRAAVLCALDTLLRLGSVCALQRTHDYGAHLLALDLKDRPRHKVPVSIRLRAALDATPPFGPALFSAYGPYAKTNRKRQGANKAGENKLIRHFRKAVESAGIPYGKNAGGIGFHSLRHTGATRMLAGGVDVMTVARIGGWSNLKTLQRYLHPSDDAARHAVEIVGAGVRTLRVVE